MAAARAPPETMRPSSIGPTSFLAFAVLTTTAACSIELGDQTKGDEGVLSFEYTSLDCLFGCGLDKPTLVGSEVTITTRGLDPSKRYTAKLATNAIGKIVRQDQSCSCTSSSGNTTTTRGVDPGATCAAGEEKSCFHQVTVSTENVGDAKLEIRVGDTLVDSTTMKARAATSIDVSARADGNDLVQKDGVYEAKVGTSIYLTATPYGESGQLITGGESIKLQSADPKIVKAQGYLLGLRAMATGETDVRITATGAANVLKFRIVE